MASHEFVFIGGEVYKLGPGMRKIPGGFAQKAEDWLHSKETKRNLIERTLNNGGLVVYRENPQKT